MLTLIYMGDLYVPIFISWERMRAYHARVHRHHRRIELWRGMAWPRLEPDMMWCGAGWFFHLSHLMTGVSVCDDGSYQSFIHERLDAWSVPVFCESGRDNYYIPASCQFSLAQTSFHTTCAATRVLSSRFVLLIFRTGKHWRICSTSEGLLVFSESGRYKYYIPTSSQFSIAQTFFHTAFAISYEHGNRGSRPPKPAPILGSPARWRLAIRFLGSVFHATTQCSSC